MTQLRLDWCTAKGGERAPSGDVLDLLLQERERRPAPGDGGVKSPAAAPKRARARA